jgi:hypothetical protein
MKLRCASRLVLTLSACISCMTACADDPPPQLDGGAPTDAAGAPDGVVNGAPADGAPSDAMTDLSLNDGPPVDAIADASDSGCACSRVDAGVRPDVGAIALPCFCEISSWPAAFTPRPLCPTYDAVMRCPDSGRPVLVQTYAGCNLVVVHFPVQNGADFNVYDATTHELVGAMRADDYASMTCGSDRVGTLQAGIVPGPECELTKTEEVCRPSDGGEAGAPPNDADAGCACTMADAGGLVVGEQSLACYCARGSGLCPTYDEARTSCPRTGLPRFDRLDIHAACNLVVMTNADGLGGTTHVFDATTHELVGALLFTDFAGFSCGASRVVGYRAGTFPPADCPVSQSISRCPGDGGVNPEGGDHPPSTSRSAALAAGDGRGGSRR